MKSGKAWSVQNLDDKAQDAAIEAARQAGLSLNEWLNQAIAQRVAEEATIPSPSDVDDEADGDDELSAVTGAVAKLTERIRAMDQNSRAAISGLKDRIDEIEGNLGTVADRGARDERRARSLKGVTAMVDQLAREIDNADETARSTIEGLRARVGAVGRREPQAPPPEARDQADQIGAAIRALDERMAEMAERLKRPPPVPERSQKLDDLRVRLESLLARNPEPVRVAVPDRAPALDSTLKALERRIDEAKARIAPPPTPPPAPPVEVKPVISPEQEERMRRIEEHLLNISVRISEPPPAPAKPAPSLEEQERARRIEEHLAHISGRLAEPPPPPKPLVSPEELERQRRIEEHLAHISGRLAEPPPPPPKPALSPEDEDRVRRIEARLSAITDRLAEPPPPPEPNPALKQVDNLSAAIAEIAARQRSLDDRADGQVMRREQKAIGDAVATLRSDVAGLVARVSAIARAEAEEREAFDGLAHRMDALAAEKPVDRGILDGIRGEIDALRAISEGSAREETVVERLDQLARSMPDQTRINALGEEISAVRRALETADGPRAISRLEMRVNELARGVELALNSRATAIDSTAASMAAGLAEIRKGLEDLLAESRQPKADTAAPVLAGLNSSLAEIRRAIADLAAAGPKSAPDTALVENLNTGFAELRAAVSDLAAANRASDPAGTVISGLSTSLSGIRSAIDDLATAGRKADPAAAVIAGLSDSLIGIRTAIDEAATGRTGIPAELTASLAEIKKAVEGLAAAPRGYDGGVTVAAVAGLSATLSDIRGAVEDLVVTNRYAGPGPAGAAIAGLATSLEEIRAAIDARDVEARRVDDAAIERLESRLGEMSARIEGVLDLAAPAEVVNGLHDRLEVLVTRLDRMNTPAAQPAVLDEIKSEIAAIRRDIAGREPVRIDHLEDQIRALAGRIEEVAQPDATAEQIAELESQVARIAADLEDAMPRSALDEVEANLGRLSSHLSASQDATIAAARNVARDAVRELTDGRQGDSELLRGLRNDLDRIRAASGDSDHRTQQTLNSLHGTLATVVDRLSRIEAAEAAAARAPRVETPVPSFAPAATPSIAQRRPSDASAVSSPIADFASPEPPRPDLVPARDAGQPASDPARERSAGERRGDFIAAARRAAQAAVAEAESSEKTERLPMSRNTSAFARIGQAIRNRRKPLLLAAAAVVLAIGALQVFGPALLSDGGKVAMAKIEASPAPAAKTPAPLDLASVANPSGAPKVAEPAMVPPAADAGALAPPDAIASRFGDGFGAPAADAFTPAESTPAPIKASAEAGVAPAATDTDSVEPGPAAVIGSDKLRAAATAGDPAAAFEVATRYAEGRGVGQNLATAADWYKRAATGGVAVAQYRLGSLYERGQGVPKDLTQAVNWYQRAADQGNVGAMHNLAVLMSEGVDGPPDSAKALEWFLAAGNYGVKDSQYNLGVIFARGIGHDRDMVESFKWFAIAAAQGDTDAAARRDEVGATLAPDQLAKAKAAVAAWHAKSPLPEANGVTAPNGGWDDAEGITEADRTGLVKKIQSLLAEKGFDPGPADGVEGPKTHDAVKAFQRNLGVAETGKIDPTLVATLTEKN